VNERVGKFERFKRMLKKNKVIVWFVVIGAAFNLGCLLATSVSDNPSQLEKNFPKTQLIDEQKSYTVAYDIGTKNPAWVLEVFKRGEELRKLPTSKLEYSAPLSIPEEIRPTPEEYTHAGLKIGPLLASAASISPYPLPASSPQNSDLADGFWIHFNDYTLQILNRLDVDRVLVITGPLYLPKNGSQVSFDVISQKKIAVPIHFYRAIFYPGTPHQSAWEEAAEEMPGGPSFGAPVPGPPHPRMQVKGEIYLIPNEAIDANTPFKSFKISFDEWKKLSGIILPMDNIRYYLGDI
jgi:DNA/RNA endonuclease G (NUC1)